MKRALALLLCACGEPMHPPPRSIPTPTPTATPTSTPTATPTSTSTPTATPTSTPAPIATEAACPDDMVLVDGDYCQDLRVDCLKKWRAPQNNLWVCEKVQFPTRCEGSTRRVRFCVDRYEFPNRAGERPMVMQNFYQAELHCAERGKRVCTESEWTKACEGPDNKPFPYGYERDASKCRGDRPWDSPDKQKVQERDPAEIERLWQGVPSGSQPECKSDYGVFDLPGNADELAASESAGHPATLHGRSFSGDYDNVTTGGPWYLGVRNMCRPKIYTHDESFAYYYLSWRCCREPDGAPTDPRAPKQIERGESWDKIVWWAHHSWKMPYNPLVPGDDGYSAAGPR